MKQSEDSFNQNLQKRQILNADESRSFSTKRSYKDFQSMKERGSRVPNKRARYLPPFPQKNEKKIRTKNIAIIKPTT